MSEPPEIIDLRITDVAYGGHGVGRLDNGMVVFVPYAAVGDQLRVRLTERRRHFWKGTIETILNAGPSRTTPKCRYYGQCAGCCYQHLTHAEQIRLKVEQLKSAMKRIGGIRLPSGIDPVITSPQAYGYRNKITLHPATVDGIDYGFYKADNETVMPVAECLIAESALNSLLAKVCGSHAAAANAARPQPRNLTLRSAGTEAPRFFFGKARRSEPRVGESLGERVLHVPADGFYQVNRPIAMQLITWLQRLFRENPTPNLIDAYCGSGVFALALAADAERVIGIETDRHSVRAARFNARQWGADAAEFMEGDVAQVLPTALASIGCGDTTVILDPPRAGCSRRVVRCLCESRPVRIIYVSCDPNTFARDLERLGTGKHYELEVLGLFDMFPQTAQFECVAVLNLAGES